MTKDEFLRQLERKLDVINEKERKDIIDEYRTHIEMKMQEGKTEEEAIEDFGDMDELVDEILDAYKINKKRVNRSFDSKLNQVMDDLFEGFQRFLGSFTSIDVDDVVRLVFEVLVVLILLSLLHIPFRIISAIGGNLLHSVAGFGIGDLLEMVWRFTIGVAYFVVFVVVLVNVIGKRLDRYRHKKNPKSQGTVFEDFKDSFDFDKAKEHVHSFSKKEETVNEEVNDAETIEDAVEEEMTLDDEVEDRKQSTSYHHEKGSGFVRFLMRCFFILFMIPCIGIIVALCCALGAMVVFSFQGVTLFGAYFFVIGALIVCSGCLSLLHRVLWKRG